LRDGINKIAFKFIQNNKTNNKFDLKKKCANQISSNQINQEISDLDKGKLSDNQSYNELQSNFCNQNDNGNENYYFNKRKPNDEINEKHQFSLYNLDKDGIKIRKESGYKRKITESNREYSNIPKKLKNLNFSFFKPNPSEVFNSQNRQFCGLKLRQNYSKEDIKYFPGYLLINNKIVPHNIVKDNYFEQLNKVASQRSDNDNNYLFIKEKNSKQVRNNSSVSNESSLSTGSYMKKKPNNSKDVKIIQRQERNKIKCH